VYDDGQKLNLSEDEIIEFLFSKGTLPENWRSFLDGIKLNNQYRKNWFNFREAIIDHGASNGYDGHSENKKAAFSMEIRKCHYCDKVGHYKKDCYKFKRDEYYKKDKKEDRKDENYKKEYKKGNNDYDFESKWNGGKFNRADMINKNLFQVSRIEKQIQEHQDEKFDAMAEANTSIWKDDSGATDHCCNEKELFRDISTCEINLATAGEHIITAEGIGNIDFYDESGNTCTLSEVLYIPKLRTNLFSPTRAVNKEGYTHELNQF
jgi:hypothetical protein